MRKCEQGLFGKLLGNEALVGNVRIIQQRSGQPNPTQKQTRLMISRTLRAERPQDIGGYDRTASLNHEKRIRAAIGNRLYALENPERHG